jgi:hypothetical protein
MHTEKDTDPTSSCLTDLLILVISGNPDICTNVSEMLQNKRKKSKYYKGSFKKSELTN